MFICVVSHADCISEIKMVVSCLNDCKNLRYFLGSLFPHVFVCAHACVGVHVCVCVIHMCMSMQTHTNRCAHMSMCSLCLPVLAVFQN
jgi:hypothetical protein